MRKACFKMFGPGRAPVDCEHDENTGTLLRGEGILLIEGEKCVWWKIFGLFNMQNSGSIGIE